MTGKYSIIIPKSKCHCFCKTCKVHVEIVCIILIMDESVKLLFRSAIAEMHSSRIWVCASSAIRTMDLIRALTCNLRMIIYSCSCQIWYIYSPALFLEAVQATTMPTQPIYYGKIDSGCYFRKSLLQKSLEGDFLNAPFVNPFVKAHYGEAKTVHIYICSGVFAVILFRD